MKPVAFTCAWCQRVRTSAGDWRPAEAADLESPGITHGICNECLDRETRSLAIAAQQAAAGS